MDRGEDVVLDEPLAEYDRVFVVEPLPRHERHDDVAAQGQVAAIGARAVSQHLTPADEVALAHNRPLVDARRLVGPDELLEPVLVLCPIDSGDLKPVGGNSPGERGRSRGEGTFALDVMACDRGLSR